MIPPFIYLSYTSILHHNSRKRILFYYHSMLYLILTMLYLILKVQKKDSLKDYPLIIYTVIA